MMRIGLTRTACRFDGGLPPPIGRAGHAAKPPSLCSHGKLVSHGHSGIHGCGHVPLATRPNRSGIFRHLHPCFPVHCSSMQFARTGHGWRPSLHPGRPACGAKRAAGTAEQGGRACRRRWRAPPPGPPGTLPAAFKSRRVPPQISRSSQSHAQNTRSSVHQQLKHSGKKAAAGFTRFAVPAALPVLGGVARLTDGEAPSGVHPATSLAGLLAALHPAAAAPPAFADELLRGRQCVTAGAATCTAGIKLFITCREHDFNLCTGTGQSGLKCPCLSQRSRAGRRTPGAHCTCAAALATASGILTTSRLPMPSCGLDCMKASARAAWPRPRLGACLASGTRLRRACGGSARAAE